MLKYILKRLLYILVVFFILSFLIYMIYNMLPVDKAAAKAREEAQANKNVPNPAEYYEERYEYWKNEYGLNGNKFERYLRWLGLYPYADGDFNGLLQGNLGMSVEENKPVAEVLVESGKPVPMLRVGVEDTFGRSGPAWELLDLYGLTAPHIVNKVKAVLALK